MVRSEQNDGYEGIGADLLHLFYVVDLPQLGETKRFQYNKLVLEVTNVAYSETKTGLDHGTDPYDYTVYTLYPGARLTVVNADMLDGSLTEDGQPRGRYYVLDSSKIYSELPEEYVFLTDGMKLMLTPDMTHVGTEMVSILRFEWVDDANKKPAGEPPLTLEQSIAQAILQGRAGYNTNAELHKTLVYDTTPDGLFTVYVVQDAVTMGWIDGQFAVDSASGDCAAYTFRKDEQDNYTLENVRIIDPKATPDDYAALLHRIGGDRELAIPNKPREILFGFGAEPANVTMVGKYLPEGVFSQAYMPDFEEVFGSDGVICYYWSKSEGEGDILQTIRKIELVLCDEGVAYYHFKDYGIDDGYKYPQVNLTQAQAGKLAADFARDFWLGGDKLSFKHTGEGSSSLYDPGKIENWQAQRDGKQYNVMVDLPHGAVVYATIEAVPIDEPQYQSSPAPTTTQAPPSRTRQSITMTREIKQDGLVLKVFTGYQHQFTGEPFTLTATVTNTTDKDIVFGADNTPDLHSEIRVSIPGTNDGAFTDIDIWGKLSDLNYKYVVLKAGETYTQTMRFLPGKALGSYRDDLSKQDIDWFPAGEYEGTAIFAWHPEYPDAGLGPRDAKLIELRFPVILV